MKQAIASVVVGLLVGGVACAGESFEDLNLEQAEQDITVQQVYGFQMGDTAAQMRCVAGSVTDCLVPEYRTHEVQLNFAGVPAEDQSTINAALTNAISLGNLPDNNFTWQTFSGHGVPQAGENACVIDMQSAFTPATTSATDIRKYLGGYTYGNLFDVGSYRSFNVLHARGNWTGFKAQRGVAVGTCSPTPITNGCYKAALKFILSAMANCGGVGFTTNVSADNTGADRDAASGTTSYAAGGDICRMKEYESNAPLTIEASTCPI